MNQKEKFTIGVSEIYDKSYSQALKDVGELLANITIQGNAVANELRIVEIIGSLKQGKMPKEEKK